MLSSTRARGFMLIDTHCHINMMVKKEFDVPLQSSELIATDTIVEQAHAHDVSIIINVGTRHVENSNCIALAQRHKNVFATVGIHPNDSDEWQDDLKAMKMWVLNKKENKIVGIGECGMDRYYPNHNLIRQRDAFKAQIELALENNLALVVHSREAYDETLTILEEYKNNITRAVMHCFSYDQAFADIVTSWNFMLGIGGTITYPKNNALRSIVQSMNINNLVLETDAPFLPIQSMRGKQNHPQYIKEIAQFIAELRGEPLKSIAKNTTSNSLALFDLQSF
jgi:TatD DNase family protein